MIRTKEKNGSNIFSDPVSSLHRINGRAFRKFQWVVVYGPRFPKRWLERVRQDHSNTRWSMSIFTGNPIKNHTVLRIVESKNETGQRSGLMMACSDASVLGTSQVIAIDHDGAKAGNEWFPFTVDLRKNGTKTLIDATINFEPLSQRPATPTCVNLFKSSEFFDCRRDRRCAGQAQILLAAQ
jgi:hypothetical protein